VVVPRAARRLLSGTLAVAALTALALAAGASARERTVPCRESIDATPFPYVGDAAHRYRVVLGAVAVPPAFMPQVVATGERPWAYWRKAGLVVRRDARVSIEVPSAWRSRVAIVWGNGGRGVFDTLRFAGCGGGGHEGYAYAGGFVLRSPGDCVPLVVRAGGRTATVRFGLGRRCAAQAG
jgi:hypothetical protein